MYLALFYETVDDYVERRQPFRELHLAYAGKWREQGKLVMAGAVEPRRGAADLRADNASTQES